MNTHFRGGLEEAKWNKQGSAAYWRRRRQRQR
jgi:hypothetical protein